MRIDTLNRRNLTYNFFPAATATIGSMMLVLPANAPSLRINAVGLTQIPLDATGPVYVQLTASDSPTQSVEITGRNFTGTLVPVRIVLTPDNGDPITKDANLNPIILANDAFHSAIVPCDFPVNQRVALHVWKR